MGAKDAVLNMADCQTMVETCVCFQFRKASRAVTQLFDEALEPCGLRSTQLVTLVAVAVLGPASVSRLARELVMDSSTLARNLKPLIDQGLVARSAGADGRRKLVSLTKDGEAAIVAATPIWREAQSRFTAHFSAEDMATMPRILAESVAAARRTRADG